MRLIIQLAMLTGQRRTEVAGARLSELHGLEGQEPAWIIPGDVNKRGNILEGRTKNGREQRVPLSRQAAELFRRAVAFATEKDGQRVASAEPHNSSSFDPTEPYYNLIACSYANDGPLYVARAVRVGRDRIISGWSNG